MIAELNHRLSGFEDVLRGIAQGMRGLDERVRVVSEQQARLIELLTPERKPKKDGPGLDELLAAMIVRQDAQNHLLKDVADVVSKAVADLPLSVVQAIADAFAAPDGSAPHADGSAAGGRGGAA